MKKYRLAIVGPADSVALIVSVAQEYSDMELMPIVYHSAREVPDILNQKIQQADAWLFSGIAPYNYAIKSGHKERPFVYIPHAGSSLYRILLQMTLQYGLDVDKISFDTFSKQDIEEFFADLAMPTPTYYVKAFTGTETNVDMTAFHEALWQAGKIKAVVTCFLCTYKNLQNKGVPVFRIWPTRDNIRSTIDVARRACETVRFQDSQIAVQHIRVDDFEKLQRQANSSYDFKRLELRLFEELVRYVQSIQGSIVHNGDGRYTVYSTRGSVSTVTSGFRYMPLKESVARQFNFNLSGGIGFGWTAYDAEHNAMTALGLADQNGVGSWMVVHADRIAEGPLGSAMTLRYPMTCSDERMKQTAEALAVNVTTLNRLLAVKEQIGNREIKADELGLYLSLTARSARRLLSLLIEKGLAEVVAEETCGKGRPSKVYRLLLDNIND